MLERNATAPDADAAHDGTLLPQQRHNWSHSTGFFLSLCLSAFSWFFFLYPLDYIKFCFLLLWMNLFFLVYPVASWAKWVFTVWFLFCFCWLLFSFSFYMLVLFLLFMVPYYLLKLVFFFFFGVLLVDLFCSLKVRMNVINWYFHFAIALIIIWSSNECVWAMVNGFSCFVWVFYWFLIMLRFRFGASFKAFFFLKLF